MKYDLSENFGSKFWIKFLDQFLERFLDHQTEILDHGGEILDQLVEALLDSVFHCRRKQIWIHSFLVAPGD